jgi:hypothetical protein
MLTTEIGFQVPMKKGIIVIGLVLLGLLLISILVIAAIGVMGGDGARSWKLVRGGRGGTVFPIALLPVFLAAIVVGAFWIRRCFFSSKYEERQHSTNKSESKGLR